MKPENDFLELMELFMEGSLSPEQDAELFRIVRESKESRQMLQAMLAANILLVDAFRPEKYPEAFQRSVLARIQAQGQTRKFSAKIVREIRRVNVGQAELSTTRVQISQRQRSFVVRWSVPLALAATLAIVAGGVWFGLRPALTPLVLPAVPLGLRVAEAKGEANIQHSTANTQHPSETRVVVGMELHEGERVVVKDGGKVGLKYDGEETTIELLAASEAGFGAEDGAKRVNLAAGTLVCSAAPQPADRPILVATPQAEARIVGTVLMLKTDGLSTRLDVQEGTVDFVRVRDGQAVRVSAGSFAIASGDVDLKAFPRETTRVDGPVVAREDFVAGLGKWQPVQWGSGGVQPVSPADQSRLRVDEVLRDGQANRVAVIDGLGRRPGSTRIGILFDLPREGDAYCMECDFFVAAETELGGIFAGWTGKWFRMRKEFHYQEPAPGKIVVRLKTFFNGKLVADTDNPRSAMPERVYLFFDSEVARTMVDNIVVRKMLPVEHGFF